MDAITYALNHVRSVIPPQILEMAYSAQSYGSSSGQPFSPFNDRRSLEARIRENVIESRVNVDCSLVGSMQVAIDLRGINYEQYDWHNRVYWIPPDATQGRNLVSVQSLHYFNTQVSYTSGTIGTNSASNLSSAAADLTNAVQSMPIVYTANLQLIGDNVVLVRDQVQHLSFDYALIGLVDHADGMSDLNPTIYPLYAQLVEYAVKADIYNRLTVELDRGAIHAGQELGKIRDIIDDYRDAFESYRELFRERWQKAVFMNDRPRAHRFIRSMIGPSG